MKNFMLSEKPTLPWGVFNSDSLVWAKTLVNYLWISEECLDSKVGNEALCSVSLSALDLAFKNARRYPNVQFNIWIDFSSLSVLSDFFVTGHVYNLAPSNVVLQSLESIPAYVEKPHFQKESGLDVWQRVDFARLLVLQHCFETTDFDLIFYSDFDVSDVSVRHPAVLNILSDHGMVFGQPKGEHELENGYMGFSRNVGEEFLKSKLVPEADKYGLKGADLWSVFHYVIRENWDKEKGDYIGVLGVPVIEAMGYKIPEKRLYKNIGLN